MYTDLQTCLEDILRDKGVAVFRDSNQLVGMVRDLMPGKISVWKMMQRMADCGILKSFADADKGTQTEKERAIRTAIFKLVNQESIDASKAQDYVRILADAFGWAIRKESTSQEMSPQKVSIPQSAPPVKPPESAPVEKSKPVSVPRNTAQTTMPSDSNHQKLKGSAPTSKLPVSQKKKGFGQKIAGFVNLPKKLWFLLYAGLAFTGTVIAPFTNPDFSVTHVLLAALLAAVLCLGHFGKKASIKAVQAISKLIRRIGALFSGVIIYGAMLVGLQHYIDSVWLVIIGFVIFFAAMISIVVIFAEDI